MNSDTPEVIFQNAVTRHTPISQPLVQIVERVKLSDCEFKLLLFSLANRGIDT